MQFKLSSLGGKLIFSVALTLLLCMLLFTITLWGLLTFYSNRIASNNATQHIQVSKKGYVATTTQILQIMGTVAREPTVVSSTQNAADPMQKAQLQQVLLAAQAKNSLSALTVVTSDHHILAQVGATNGSETVAPTSIALIDQAFKGHEATILHEIQTSRVQVDAMLDTAVPIQVQNTAIGVLLSSQPINNIFAQRLAQNTSGYLMLCLSGRVMATTTEQIVVPDQRTTQNILCTPHGAMQLHTAQRYLAEADNMPSKDQLVNSPSLVIVAIEPLYSFNSHLRNVVLLIAGLLIFIFALGIGILLLVIQTLFIRPLRHLQNQVGTMLADDSMVPSIAPSSDEFAMLSRSFSLLSETLDLESQALIEQMKNVLIMSDVLVSTLDLEHLLGEIVSRLGQMMQVKNVSLLLYGREMLSPWAVAQWNAPHPMTPATDVQAQKGAVTVHTDPNSDITMAVTTKMAAIPNARLSSYNGNTSALHPPKLPQNNASAPYGLRRPRIPRPALRDLDMNLARMVIQRKKIAYGEDVAIIHRERNENWARMALETGYRSVLAVPLLLQDQAIGAFILYNDTPYQISGRDTFLLSTAAIQASMAIQNALLFEEGKDKNAALERANQLKSQFLATVTHELRTPLHGIISYGDLILDGFLDGDLTEEQEEHIRFMVRSAEELSHLVNDMLDLSKIEADHIEVHVEQIELTLSLNDVVNQLKTLASSKGLQILLRIEPGLPMVMADSHRIRQIVINLVSNALKFTEKGGVTIECAVTQQGDMVRVAVHDTGIGISPAALGYIFEAFRQADGSTTRRFGGTGLGLTIARKLIELQGGEVAVESVIGQGSTFSFTLPVVTPSKGRLLSYGKQRR